MRPIIENGWLTQAKHVPSPFFDARSDINDISLLVVHNISLPPGQFGGPYIEDFFTGKLDPNEHPFFEVIHKMGVSAHCLIKRNGEVVQFVSFSIEHGMPVNPVSRAGSVVMTIPLVSSLKGQNLLPTQMRNINHLQR